jgi:glycerophosphoryl diester phosphodiesterase
MPVRRSRALLGALVVLGGAYAYLATFHRPQRAPDHPYFDAPRPWVIAHRGGMALAPENTTEAFRRAEALGVDVLEMDLRVTADGAFAVIHDSTVDRTTEGHGPVAELSLAQLQALDAGYRFVDDSGGHPFRGVGLTVPSFQGVLRQFPDIRLNVEMKDFTLEQARGLCATLRQFDAVGRVLVSAFAHAPMAAFREACPEVATGATRREAVVFYYLSRVRLARAFRSPAAAMQLPLSFRGRGVITPGLLEAARESNRPVQVWTVNDEPAMRRLLSLDVQAILTDRPSRLLALMGRPRRPASPTPEASPSTSARTTVRASRAHPLQSTMTNSCVTVPGRAPAW